MAAAAKVAIRPRRKRTLTVYVVILSGVAASRSEAATQSKDPYKLHTVAARFIVKEGS
jgi:hypothetical protein